VSKLRELRRIWSIAVVTELSGARAQLFCEAMLFVMGHGARVLSPPDT